MSFMTRFVLLGLALVLLASTVDAHGWMSSPAPRGQYREPKRFPYEEIAPAAINDTSNPNIVCRSDPEMPRANWLPLRAGQSQSITLEITAKHPGDCFVYLTYDGAKPMAEMKWFKIWQQHDCKAADHYDVPIPSYLPSGEHVIFRWEWYALHIFPVVEYYAQCVDAVMTGTAGGALPLPQVTMPGHLPISSGKIPNNNYWDPFNTPADQQGFTGPALATPNGQASTPAPTPKATTPAPATPAPTSAPATPAPTQKPSTAPTQKATAAPSTPAPATPAPTQKATAAPATPAPTQKATAAPATPAPTQKATASPATPAPTSQFVKLNVLPDSGNWWFAARVTGHRANEVAKVEIKYGGGNWVPCTNEWSDVWVYTPKDAALSYPITVKASLASGSSLSFTVNRLPTSVAIDSGSVFP